MLLAAWSANHVVVVNASMSWCRHCKSMIRPMERLAEAYPDLKFLKFYGNANPNLKALFKNRLRSRGVPAFYVYKGGKVGGMRSNNTAVRAKCWVRLIPKLKPGRTAVGTVLGLGWKEWSGGRHGCIPFRYALLVDWLCDATLCAAVEQLRRHAVCEQETIVGGVSV